MKRIRRFNENYDSGDSELVIEVNDILSKDEVYEKIDDIIRSLPTRIKSKLGEYFSDRTIDIDQIEKIEKRFNVFQRVKDLYNKGIKSASDIFSKIYPKREGLIYGIAMVVFILIIIVLTFISLAYIFDLPRRKGVKGMIFAFLLIIPFMLGEIAAWPLARYSSAMIEYKINGESEHVKLQEDKNGKLKIVEIKAHNLTIKDDRDIPTEPNW
jgi:hypothetical protein